MSTYFLVLIFIGVLGSVFGSFFNMLIYRLPRNYPIVFKPSHCPHCQTRLSIQDLIPILSFCLTKGRCRHCHQPILIRYLLVEIAFVIISLILYLYMGLSVLLLIHLWYWGLMLVIFFIDLETQIIPDKLSFLLISSGLLLAVFNQEWVSHIAAGATTASIFIVIGYIGKLFYKKDVLGGGDIKLIAGIGAFWGLKIALLTIYLSFILGGIGGALLLLLKIKSRHDLIPFGPFIIVASMISVYFSNSIIALIL